MRGAEGVTRLFHEFFFEGEVGQGVVDQLVDHFGHGHRFEAVAGDVEVVDHLHDALVLVIDDLDAGVEVFLPGE
ncbi:hypothetical protein D3C81_1868610 [compost metagenome]